MSKNRAGTREQKVTGASLWRHGGQEGCRGNEASRQRGQHAQRPSSQAHGPMHSRSLPFLPSLYFPFLLLGRARLWTAGTSDTPVTTAHLVLPHCCSRAPTPASILYPAWGGPVRVVAGQDAGEPAAWALRLRLGLIFPICEPRGLRPGSVRTGGSVISGVVLAAGTERASSTTSGFHEEHHLSVHTVPGTG